MLIGIDASRANTANRTGTEWYSFHVIEGLKKRIPSEHHVVLYTKEPLCDDLAALPSHWESRVLGWKPGLLWTQIRLSWEMLLHKPDLLYVPAHTIPMIHPRNTVTVIHDVGFVAHDALYDKKNIGKDKRGVSRLLNGAVRVLTLGRYGSTEGDYHRFSTHFALQHAKQVITVSEFTKRELQSFYAVSSKTVEVIPNGFNRTKSVRLDEQEAKSILKRYGVTKPYLLFIGRIEEKKNVSGLVEAFHLLRTRYGFRGQLVLVGRPGFRYERVTQSIDSHHLRDLVRETGWLDEHTAAALLQHADLFILPSFYEGFGIPILEAMSVGVPVVCSDIAALHEVGDDAALYASPHEPEKIAAAMHAVLSTQQIRAQLVSKGLQRVHQFSWERTADTTWQLLQKVTASQS